MPCSVRTITNAQELISQVSPQYKNFADANLILYKNKSEFVFPIAVACMA